MHSTTVKLDKTTLAIKAASADIHDISELAYLFTEIIPYRAPLTETDYS
jgi:hypothetical protein